MLHLQNIIKRPALTLFGLLAAGMLMATTAIAAPAKTVAPEKPVMLTNTVAQKLYTGYLKSQGVKIIHLGETVTLVYPSDQLFHYDSANMASSYKKIMQASADLLKTYSTVTVNVAAYSDDIQSGKRKHALTTRQSQVISSYLWSQGINTRMLVAKGYGHKSPIAVNWTGAGRSMNRRVVISFRYYPPYKSYE